jgi:CubicO group peptidase (beta-lactamase class C family)
MVLVERKLIDLDKPANEYLGDAKLRARVGNADMATVRRVANHTSGLPLHYQFFYADETFRPPTRDETIRRFGNLVTEPGEHYQYSNLGFGVLDYLVERKSGKKFADFMREEVFLPLGMTHTSIDVGPGLEPHQAIRYTQAGLRIPFYDFDHPGASAVYASAHDLARFGMFHMKEHLADQRPILSDASIDEMQKPTATTPNGAGYGIGWGSADIPRGYHTVEHSGGMPGVATLCTLVPSERLAVVVLSNSSNMFPKVISNMILKILLPERKPEAGSTTKRDGDSGPYKPFAPSSELLGTWKGRLATYQGETPLVLTIKESGDVHVRLDRQLETLLNGPSFKDGFLRGRFGGDVGTDDNRGRPYQLRLEVKLRGETLQGPVTATTLPDKWGSSAVTHWVELAREATAGTSKPAAAAGEGK